MSRGTVLVSLALALGGTAAHAQQANFGAIMDACRNGRQELKVQACTDALARLPANAVAERAFALVERGLGYRRTNRADLAIADYDAALRLDPNSSRTWNNRGYAFFTKGDVTRAFADWEQALRLDPRNATVYVNRAEAYSRAGQYDQALAQLEQALVIDPASPKAIRERGYVHVNRNALDAALADFERAIQLEPAKADGYIGRSLAFLRRQQLDRAIADAEIAVRVAPRFAGALVQRGAVLRAQGQFDRALADFNAALALDAGNEVARRGVASVLEARGQRALVAKAPVAPPPALPPLALTTAKPATPPIAAAPPAQQIAALPPSLLTRVDAPRPVVPVTVALAEKRVALVIGNGAYVGQPALVNPSRDAEAIGAVLRTTGFQTVTVVKDLDRARMLQALKEFESQAEQADWAVIYYAGHGIEVGGVNFMIPVDAKLKSDRDIEDEGISLDRITRTIDQAKKMRLVILDACRDNPFEAQMKRSIATRAVGKVGLAAVEPAGGTLVAFAAAKGKAALDGQGTNSPFVQALVNRINQPGLEINKLFRHIRDDVLAATGKQQEPFVYGSLPAEDFYFRPKKG